MKQKQSGFTLIEIAIVLVIIGLLLGGVMKGQELINSAKVKNLASDFKNTSLYIYSYQDKFRALPGDDPAAASHVTGATVATPIVAGQVGNGRIDGAWDSTTPTHESFLFWEHVRLAGIATGITNKADTVGYPQRNTLGGLVGITNSTAADNPITALKGAYIICSSNIQGKFAKQLDIMMDDGSTITGSMMTLDPSVAKTAKDNPADTELYTVCMGV
ncbi:MAG: type II secretion system GspH family protein [Gammaproteobacteria bacterium]|nr:type II secretion system GspH family protein [Gammaproteobacteria bacterium]MBU1446822.1 type II secretion system GspH family protein [Gammaproteobacteria bacterium]